MDLLIVLSIAVLTYFHYDLPAAPCPKPPACECNTGQGDTRPA